jgi:hypothetical protein
MTDMKLLTEVTAALGREADAIPDQSRIQPQFARFQIRNIRNLAEGFLILERESKLEVAGCLARPTVEAFLNLKASLTDASFAASKCVADIGDAIKLDQVRKEKCPIPEVQVRLQATIDANLKIRDNLMKHHRIPSSRRWNAKEIAEVGKLVPFYDTAYSTFHPAIHAGLDGNSIESSTSYISLVVYQLTVIVMDTFMLTLKEFAPGKIGEYEEELKGWRRNFETNSTMP